MSAQLLHRLVSEAAAVGADRIAVTAPDPGGVTSVTYGELDRHAAGLARRLVGLGVRRGDRVVLWADKSTALVAAMQAVLRAGAAYVPLDPTSPPQRVASVSADCAARLVLVDGQRGAQLAGLLPETVGCAVVDVPSDHAPGPAPALAVTPGELAYVLYTSGSTGAPKGVCVSHRAATAFVDWAARELDARPEDRFANHASLAFDLSVLDLYVAFAAGASVRLLPQAVSTLPAELVDVVRRERTTVWYSVPSALTLMIRLGGLCDQPAPSSLRAVLFAGEPFPIADVRRLAGWTSARLLNLYGPTETNVCTYHEVRPEDLARERPVPIGRPACGDRVRALRRDGAECRSGQRGELVVDGPTVMRGYWGREPQRGPYRTGDVVEVLPDGAFDFVGRNDDLVKVRGFRVALGEVEGALLTHPDVAQAGTVVVGAGLDATLVAVVVPEPGRRPGLLGVKAHLAERLPSYLNVDAVVVVDDLPRTRNGKLDRAALGDLASVNRGTREGVLV